MSIYLLADNGSTRPAATLQLRKLAEQLGNAANQQIHPVSLMHANRIDPAQLNGKPAQTFEVFLRQMLKQGEREFVVIPLFFGKSKALTSFIPDKYTLLAKEFGEFSLQVADVIYPLPKGEHMLAAIIYEHIQQAIATDAITQQSVVLVDHGSPIPQVTAVREHLAASVQSMLGDNIQLDEAVMERREGSEYDFNGQLLADYLGKKAAQGVKHIAVIMMFFLPGRHAGEGGDIEEICRQVQDNDPGLQIRISPLIAGHPGLLSILTKRLNGIS